MKSFTLQTTAEAIALLVLGWLCARFARYIFKKTLPKKLSTHENILLQRLVFYVVFIIFSLSALRHIGIDLRVLLGAAGIFSVAIGFASQTSASNLISGLFLLAERPFSVGDSIQLGQTVGEVTSIDLLSVKLRTQDNLMVRIPNETIIKSEVTTLTRFEIRRLDLVIGVAYKENLAEVKKVLLQVADEYPLCLAEPEPWVIILGFGPSSVDIQLSAWCSSVHFLKAKSALLEDIKLAFDQAGIGIPFPQLEVHTI